MKLYVWGKAPNPRRVLIYLEEKGIDVPLEDVGGGKGRLKPEYLARYPQATVPMLELDDGTQIGEAMAICRYFEELHPEPPLMGVDARDKAIVEMWERRAYEEGLLAYGYSILLDHVEKQRPGCVGNALNCLKSGVSQPVGEQLYDYLISEGRVSESYPDFVKSALVAAVPEPGLWFQFRILESKEDTRIFQRPSARLGDSELSGQRLASDAQRYAEHKFKMTLGPLTLRCVQVSADSIREVRGVGVKITSDGAASDNGWIATVRAGAKGKTEAKPVAAEGTHVVGLGKDHAAVWIAVFNPDSMEDRRYELSVFLRKDTKSPFRAS